MSIYKKIDGKDVKVAENNVIDHNQLSGRESYNAHPISAIRNLPEKLTNLKNVTKDIQTKAGQINLEPNDDGTFTFTNYDGEQSTIQGGYQPDGSTIQLREIDSKEKLTAVGLKTQGGVISGQYVDNEIKNIKSIINNKGGYLDSYDFGHSDLTQEELNEYAIQDIGDISDISEIWNGTRVINLYDNHTWSWDLNSLSWSDLGDISFISDANNDGLHGLVTGSLEDYMGSITSEGQIAVNGLPELADQVETNTENIATNTSDIDDLQELTSTHTSDISQLQGDLADEITARQEADNALEQVIIGKVVDAYSTDQTKAYSANYVNNNFAPLSLIGRLYFDKKSETAVDLSTAAPTVAVSNVITKQITSSTIDWNTPDLVATRTFDNTISLNKESGITFNIALSTDVDCSLAIGARIKTSTDNGTSWTYISTAQTFSFKSLLTADSYSNYKFRLYSDSIENEKVYTQGTLYAVELFLIEEHAVTANISIYCGVDISSVNIYSTGEFALNNVMVDTDEISDHAVTYAKLSTDLQTLVDKINGNESNIAGLQTSKQDKNLTFTNVEVDTWASDATYSGYSYKASIALTGVDATMIPTVIFNFTDSASGNYLSTVETYAGGVYVWSKVNSAITIPLILIQKQ